MTPLGVDPREWLEIFKLMNQIALSIMAVGFAATSAFLCVKNKDGSGWAFLSFLITIMCIFSML